MVDEICSGQPHYLRLATVAGSKKAPKRAHRPNVNCGVATATWVDYDPSRAFETLPEALTAVHRKDPGACVIIEADTDPSLRHAYPYDCHIFAMPAPTSVHEVFRTPQQAELALQAVLHDTASFASEIYGLFAEDDSGADDVHEQRPDMSDSQIVTLLHAPLGQELASRIQCQPQYHGLLESDVVVVNTGVGGTSADVDEVVRRLEKLVRRTRADGAPRPSIFCCDLRDAEDPRRKKLFEHLRKAYEDRD